MNLRPRPLPSLLALMLAIALTGCGKKPEEHFSQGKALLEKGETQGAILELKTTLQAQPKNAEARLLLGKTYLAIEAYAAAEKELQQARDAGIAVDQVLPLLAKTRLRMGEAQKALDLSIPPGSLNRTGLAAMQAIRAEAFLTLDKKVEAEQAIALAEQADSNQPDLLILKARLAAQKQDFAQARQLLDNALQRDPTLVYAYYLKAAMLEEENNLDEALKTYQTALKHEPKAFRAHLIISEIELRRGNKEAGEKALQAAEKAAPKQGQVKYARGIFELRRNNFKAANDALLQVLRVAPDFVPAQLASAMVNLGLGNHEQSLKAAQQVLAKQPGNPLALRIIAASHLKTGEPKEALSTITPLLQTRQDDPRLLALAGEAYLQNKDYQQALTMLNKAEVLAPNDPEIRNRQAASLLALGQVDQALAELEAATQRNDKINRADLVIVSIHLQRRDFDKALHAIDLLEKKLPNSAITHNLRALALLGKRDKAAARISFEKAVALDAKFFPAVANLARLDLADKQPQAAKKRFEDLLHKDANNLQATMALAELSLLNKREDEYVSWLEKAIKAHPEAMQPKALLSSYHLSKQDKDKALSLSMQAVKDNPDSVQALSLLGTTQMASEDAKSAVETYKKLAGKTPDSPDLHLRLGLAQAAARAPADARNSFNAALRLKPNFLPAMDALIALEVQEKNPAAALQWAQKQQALYPKAYQGFDREGDIHMSQQRFAQAAKSYQQAMDRGAGTDGLLKLHGTLVRAGDSKTAQAALERWVKLHPTDLNARTHLAKQALLSGQDKLAIAQYEEILRRKPNEVLIQNNLANLYQRVKDPRALSLAEKAYQAAPQNASVQDTLGWILLEQGQTQKGMDLLSKAALQASSDPSIQYHYAAALARSGDRQKAKEILRKVLDGQTRFPETEAAKSLLASLS